MANIYKVNRSELIQWINDLLCLNYTKVEDTGNGAAFCQVIDAIHPGTVNLKNVDYNAFDEPGRLNNYKILQDSFTKNGIMQFVDVANLSKGKFMATLEMLQFIHAYYDQTKPHKEYDAVDRRKKTRCKEPRLSGANSGSSSRNAAAQSPPQKKVTPRNPVNARKNANSNNLHNTKIFEPTKRKTQNTNSDDIMKKENAELKKHVKELEDDVDQMNQERDFYYNKLRKVEEYCQDHEELEELKPILDILYEPDEEHGFFSPEEEDEADD